MLSQKDYDEMRFVNRDGISTQPISIADVRKNQKLIVIFFENKNAGKDYREDIVTVKQVFKNGRINVWSSNGHGYGIRSEFESGYGELQLIL